MDTNKAAIAKKDEELRVLTSEVARLNLESGKQEQQLMESALEVSRLKGRAESLQRSIDTAAVSIDSANADWEKLLESNRQMAEATLNSEFEKCSLLMKEEFNAKLKRQAESARVTIMNMKT